MNYEAYGGVEVTANFDIFDFVSTGSKGNVLKRVSFTKTEDDSVYNLAFGDVDENNEINDLAVTGNGDRNKVISTVVSIVGAYTKRFPERWITFRGSTEERTRLYRMVISLHLDELSALYEIWAYLGDEMVPIDKGVRVKAFLISRKK